VHAHERAHASIHPHLHPTVAAARPLAQAPETDGRAILALVLGVTSMTCFGFLAGIPAIVLGSMARRDIERSEGRRTGSQTAAAGMVTGLFGTGLSLVVAVMLLGGALESASPGTSSADPPVAEAHGKGPFTAGTRSYGSLDVVDLDGDRTLKPQLAEVARTASARGRTVILQTYVRSSRECAEVAESLDDPRMQRALANVTLVRADIESFEGELRAMRVSTDAAPWFYKLDGTAHPTDALSADEWDANLPENMAPILADFAKGARPKRRAPPTPSPSPGSTAL